MSRMYGSRGGDEETCPQGNTPCPYPNQRQAGLSATSLPIYKTGGFHAPESGLANHLVRLDQERRGEHDPEGLGGLEIEDELELHGLLYWQVGRLRTLEDLVHK